MTLNRTLSIAKRIVKQIVKDHRSLAMIFVAPLLVMALVGSNFSKSQETLNFIGPALICTFVLFFTFMLTGISFLRERSEGTLDRLLTTPVSRADIIFGYSLSFFVFALIQSTIILLFSISVLDIAYIGSLWQMFVVVIMLAIVAVNLGVFVSTFAKNEFQVIQFIPLIMAPQIFLSGVIQPVEKLPSVLQNVSKILPLTYGIDSLRSIMIQGFDLYALINEILILFCFGCVFILLAAVSIKR